MIDPTAPARNKAMRQRRKEAGLVLFRAWVPADKLQAVKDAVDEVTIPARVSEENARAMLASVEAVARAQDRAMAAIAQRKGKTTALCSKRTKGGGVLR